ncbi:MAG TPA: hypothetical protein VFH83_00320, partial [Spirochaetia bacterium]|nr:hypothetical protein [Spirochaetia bacterium]
EVRTTFAPAVLSLEDLRRMAELVRGCARFVIQAFHGGKTLDSALTDAASPTRSQMNEAASQFQAAGIPVQIR